MKTTEAQRAAVKKYDAEHMAWWSVKVKKELLEEFRATCKANGDKANTILREAMERYIDEKKRPGV